MKLRRSIVLGCLALVATAVPFAVPAADAQAPAAGRAAAVHPAAATHAGMTWTTAEQRPNGEVHVSGVQKILSVRGLVHATLVP